MVKLKLKIITYLQKALGIIDANPHFYTKYIFQNKKFIIGEHTYGKPTILFENDNSNLIIGKYCSISSNVVIFLGGNHRQDWVSTYPFNVLNETYPTASEIIGHPSTNGDVNIGNDVWIGYGVTILSGISISDGAIIAANSTLTKNVGPYEIWGGNPAKFIKKRFDDATIEQLMSLKWWDKDEEYIKKNIHLLLDKPEKILKNDSKI